jgi:dihydroneopterin aldolase
MNDIIYIRELKVDTLIGIHEQERKLRQTVTVDIEMTTDIRKVAASDDIRDAVDYEAVAVRMGDFIRESRVHLLEALAEECAAIILAEFRTRRVRLKMGKTGVVSGTKEVGVIIERESAPCR